MPAVPKMKTNRAAAKRFRTTGKGRIRRSKAYAGHILTSKTRRQKRRLRKNDMVHPSQEARIRRLIPYR